MSDGTGNDFWAGKSILLTGAGGFVGSWLTLALVERHAAVTVLLRDRPSISNFQYAGLGRRVNVVSGTLEDYPVIERVLAEYNVDTCFHLAAQSIVGAANRSPLSTFEANIKGTWNVLEACLRGRRVRRVVIASSDKAYGDQPHLPYVEDMPLNGRYPYDVSKACADRLARCYFDSFGLPVVVARCANIYGGGDCNFSRLVPGTIRSALAGERPIIRSDGTPVRDYLYIDDAVNAYLALGANCERAGVLGEAFNFGADNPVSVLDLVRRILAAANRDDLQPDVQGAGKLEGEIDRQYLSSQKAHSLLRWAPSVGLDEGLERTVTWYQRFFEDGTQSSGETPVTTTPVSRR